MGSGIVPEAKILKHVISRMILGMMVGDVLFYTRLQSLQIGKVRVGKPGLPDVVAIISQGNGAIAVLFIEVKRSTVKRLRFEQQEFFNSMLGKPKILCEIINDKSQIGPAIERAKRC
jgi:hypothetical protein